MNAQLMKPDRARWNRVHTAITVALGIGWMLDAFEVTIVNNVISTLRELWRLTSLQASWILSIWFVGIMVGAYRFRYLADRFGRRGMLLGLALLAAFWCIRAVAMIPGCFCGIEAISVSREALAPYD